MNKDETKTKDTAAGKPAAKPATETVVLCTVLVPKTRIREVLKGQGAKVRLPLAQAQALASLSPPRVAIEGV
jgi:hypothetical protein